MLTTDRLQRTKRSLINATSRFVSARSSGDKRRFPEGVVTFPRLSHVARQKYLAIVCCWARIFTSRCGGVCPAIRLARRGVCTFVEVRGHHYCTSLGALICGKGSPAPAWSRVDGHCLLVRLATIRSPARRTALRSAPPPPQTHNLPRICRGRGLTGRG